MILLSQLLSRLWRIGAYGGARRRLVEDVDPGMPEGQREREVGVGPVPKEGARVRGVGGHEAHPDVAEGC